MPSRLEQQMQKRKSTLQTSSAGVQQALKVVNGLNNRQFQEFVEALSVLETFRNEVNKVTLTFDTDDFFHKAERSQWRNFLMGFLQDDVEEYMDWSPYQQCWWCGADLDNPRLHYCPETCQEQFATWRKNVRRKASKDPEKQYEIFLEASLKRIREAALPPYVPQFNATQSFYSEAEPQQGIF